MTTKAVYVPQIYIHDKVYIGIIERLANLQLKNWIQFPYKKLKKSRF